MKEENIILNKELETQAFIMESEQKLNSYLTKEEFIELLKLIDFKAVKRCDIDLITGMIINTDEKEEKILSKTINIY